MKIKLNRNFKVISVFMFAAIIVVVMLIFLVNQRKVKSVTTDKLETAATINDIPVARGEAALFMAATETGSGLESAVESLVWYKIVQDKLLQAGKLDDISYEAFLEKLDAENKDRLRKAEGGEVLYGPVQYSEKVYYEYLQESYQAMWKASVHVEVSEEQLRKMYDEDESLYLKFGDVTFQYLSLEGENDTDEIMKELHKQIQEDMKNGLDFETSAKETGVEAVFNERTFTQTDLSEPDVTAYPEISEIVMTLEEGGISDPVNLGNQGLLFYCKERKQGERTPFEECKAALEEMYKENYLEQVMETEKEKAVITYKTTEE